MKRPMGRFYNNLIFMIYFSFLLIPFCLLYSCGDAEEGQPITSYIATVNHLRPQISIEENNNKIPLNSGVYLLSPGGIVKTGNSAKAIINPLNGGSIILGEDSSIEGGVDFFSLKQGKALIKVSKVPIKFKIESNLTIEFSKGSYFYHQYEKSIYVINGQLSFTFNGNHYSIDPGQRVSFNNNAIEITNETMISDWTGGLSDEKDEDEVDSSLGQIWAREPSDYGEARQPLVIRSLDVGLKLTDRLVETTIEETFFNPHSTVKEGIFRIMIPSDALVVGFAIDRDGTFVHGTIQPRRTAAAQYQQQVYQGSIEDPALLEWVNENTYQARIYPLPPGGIRRVRIVYTQWLHENRNNEDRSYYLYNLPIGSDVSPRIAEFVMKIDRSDSNLKVEKGYPGMREDGDINILRKSDFVATAPLYVEFYSKAQDNSKFLIYENDEHFLGIIDPSLIFKNSETPVSSNKELNLVVLVDRSGATDPYQLSLAQSVMEALFEGLTDSDNISVFIGDLHASPLLGHDSIRLKGSFDNKEKVLESMARINSGGATDLASMIVEAVQNSGFSDSATLIYLGDGNPTVGENNIEKVREKIDRIPVKLDFYCIGLGDNSNQPMFKGIAKESNIFTVSSVSDASKVAWKIISRAFVPQIQDLKIEFEPSSVFHSVYPGLTLNLLEGDSITLSGKISQNMEIPETAKWSGIINGKLQKGNFKIEIKSRLDDNIEKEVKLRWAKGRLEKIIASGESEETIVELGTRYGILTPYTSFYVPSRYQQPQDGEARREGESEQPQLPARDRAAGDDQPSTGVVFPSQQQPQEQAIDETTGLGGLGTIGHGRGGGGIGQGYGIRAEGDEMRKARFKSAAPTKEISENDNRVTESQSKSSDVISRIDNLLNGTLSVNISSSMTTKVFIYPHQAIRCSTASKWPLPFRKSLWEERLQKVSTVPEAINLWNEAKRTCEAEDWRSQREFLLLILNKFNNIDGWRNLDQALARHSTWRQFIRNTILQRITNMDQLRIVQEMFNLSSDTVEDVLEAMLNKAATPQQELLLIQRILRTEPQRIELRFKLLLLFEQLNRISQANRTASMIRQLPWINSEYRAMLAAYYLRQNQVNKAREVLSEIVEFSPQDPTSRKLLGDFYYNLKWYEESLSQYNTLGSFMPQDESVKLKRAMATYAVGKTDESIRIAQEIIQSGDLNRDSISSWAQVWLKARLSLLAKEAMTKNNSEELNAIKSRLRQINWGTDSVSPLQIIVMWYHPFNIPQIEVNSSAGLPIFPQIVAVPAGIYGINIFEDTSLPYTLKLSYEPKPGQLPLRGEIFAIYSTGGTDITQVWYSEFEFPSKQMETKQEKQTLTWDLNLERGFVKVENQPQQGGVQND